MHILDQAVQRPGTPALGRKIHIFLIPHPYMQNALRFAVHDLFLPAELPAMEAGIAGLVIPVVKGSPCCLLCCKIYGQYSEYKNGRAHRSPQDQYGKDFFEAELPDRIRILIFGFLLLPGLWLLHLFGLLFLLLLFLFLLVRLFLDFLLGFLGLCLIHFPDDFLVFLRNRDILVLRLFLHEEIHEPGNYPLFLRPPFILGLCGNIGNIIVHLIQIKGHNARIPVQHGVPDIVIGNLLTGVNMTFRIQGSRHFHQVNLGFFPVLNLCGFRNDAVQYVPVFDYIIFFYSVSQCLRAFCFLTGLLRDTALLCLPPPALLCFGRSPCRLFLRFQAFLFQRFLFPAVHCTFHRFRLPGSLYLCPQPFRLVSFPRKIFPAVHCLVPVRLSQQFLYLLQVTALPGQIQHVALHVPLSGLSFRIPCQKARRNLLLRHLGQCVKIRYPGRIPVLFHKFL